jgi:hypothetical protein
MAKPWEKFLPAATQTASKPWDRFKPTEEAQQKPRLDQSYGAGLARSALGQGTLFGFGDEIMAGLRSLGDETYDDALVDERAKLEQFREENPGTALAGEIVGSLATPGLGLATGAVRAAPTVLGRVAQGAKLGAGYGAGYGFASGEGGLENRLENAGKGAVIGAGTGAVLPAAGAVVGGTAKKVSDTIAPALARRRGGNEAAADKIMVDRLAAAGETPQAMRDRLAEADRAGTFYGGNQSASKTESPLALTDVSSPLQRLGGSAVRSSDEARARAESFIGTRQTGVTPQSKQAVQFADEGALQHKNPLAPLPNKAKPAGQYERVKDALTRSMTLEDKDFHKFGKNAYRTEQAMMAKLKQEADVLYRDARTASQNFNVAPVIDPVLKKIAADAAQAPVGEARLIKNALRQFTTENGGTVTSLEAFDKAKRYLDGLIGRVRTSGDKNAERLFTGVKNELVDAVDNIAAQDIGSKYKAARNYFSSQMEMKDAIDLGRQAFKENSDVVSDQFRGLTDGQKKLFRLGLIESFEANLGRGKRTNDVTQIFETPRVQDLLREVIPRTETATGRVKKGAVYADRPERFGDFLANEKAMIGTRNRVLGGSPTADKLADDAKFTRQSVGQMFDALRGAGGITGIVLEATTSALNKVFGMREDVAAEIGRRLFTANPAEREAIIRRLEAVNPSALPKFLETMRKVNLVASPAISGQSAQGAVELPPLRGGSGPMYEDGALVLPTLPVQSNQP